MGSTTNSIVIAIIIAIVIVLIINSRINREAFTTAECGNDAIVTVPYQPLSLYDAYTNSEPPTEWAEIGYSPGSAQDIATACDQMPGCVGFTTYGTLLGGYRPRQYWRATTDKSTYIRRCTDPEPMFFEWFTGVNYTGTRYIMPVGKYKNSAGGITTLDGQIMGTSSQIAYSLRIPTGISVVFFYSSDCNVNASYIQLAGNWPHFVAFGSNKKHFIACGSYQTYVDTSYITSPRILAGMPYI